MTEKEFDYVYAVHKNNDTAGFASDIVLSCTKNGWVKDNAVTDEGYEAIAPYKVDNAIIMAAGRSRRCMPLSNYLPKGLFEIKELWQDVKTSCHFCFRSSIRKCPR